MFQFSFSCCSKSLDKTILVRKGLCLTSTSNHGLSLKEVRNHGRKLLTGFSPGLAQFASCSTMCPGLVLHSGPSVHVHHCSRLPRGQSEEAIVFSKLTFPLPRWLEFVSNQQRPTSKEYKQRLSYILNF